MKTCTDKSCKNQHNTRFKLCSKCRRARRESWQKMQANKPRREMTPPGSYQMSADEFEQMQEAPALTALSSRQAYHWGIE